MSKQLSESIVKAGAKFSLEITGGGMGAIGELTRYGGTSPVFMSANVPYGDGAWQALKERWAGYCPWSFPTKYVSRTAAEFLAHAALQRVLGENKPWIGRYIGLGATSKLRKDDERPDREHKLCIACSSSEDNSDDDDLHYYAEYEVPHEMSREEQETWCEQVILKTLLGFCDYSLQEGIKVDV